MNARGAGEAPQARVPTRWAALLVALCPLTTTAGFLSGPRLAVPILSAAPAYAAMVLLLRRGERGKAVAAMLVWALLLGASMTVLCVAMPERAAAAVLNGPAYWQEMSVWIETGRGAESAPREFIPQHLMHAVVFVALSVATGSLLSVIFGAALMHYMAYYVARVVLQAPSHPVFAGILGWHPWSILRIASFVVLGVVLSEPLLLKIPGASRPPGRRAPWLLLALAGLVLDVLLKTLLAPHWRIWLRALE